MAYNNYNRGNYNSGYNGGRQRYGFSPYNSGYNNGRGGYQPQAMQGGWGFKPPKRSGCTKGITRTGKPYVRGWKVDKTHGMRSFIAGPNVKTKVHSSKTGHEWENWTVKVSSPHGTELYNCLFSPESGRVFIKDLGIVMSPKTNYTGPFFRRKGR